MKRLKSLTRIQKKALSKRGHNSNEWKYAGIREDPDREKTYEFKKVDKDKVIIDEIFILAEEME